MAWLSETDPVRRPILLVEDHLYHIGDALAWIERQVPEVFGLLTVVCLDRPGPDTRRSVAQWRERWPLLRVAAANDPGDDPRQTPLPAEVFERPNDLARVLGSLLRPGGLLLQDIQLETLGFIPRERWWESIYVATSVRGMFPDDPPTCRFLSNKRGYEATFGCDLLDAGFDPRDVLDKGALERLLVPTLKTFLEQSMPWRLERPGALDTVIAEHAMARAEVEEALDLVLWLTDPNPALGGRRVRTPERKPRVELKAESPEGETWCQLFADVFDQGEGVAVLDVGERIAPARSGRAEQTNCAARHVHNLRGRLDDPNALRTVAHTYRLDRRLRLGRVTRHPLVRGL